MLILIRHPPVDLPPGICYGRQDVEIACGFDMKVILEKMPGARDPEIWSSPARRCVRVAVAIAENLGVEIGYDDRLRELDFGAWEGMAWAVVPRSALDAWAADPLGFAPPEGERGEQLIERVQSFYDDVCARRSTHIVISHGGPLRILAALARGSAIDLLAPSPLPGSVQVL